MLNEGKALTESTQKKPVFDPFPNLTYARKERWNWLDHLAYRRLQRLGFPSPWNAFFMGYKTAKNQELPQPSYREGNPDQ